MTTSSTPLLKKGAPLHKKQGAPLEVLHQNLEQVELRKITHHAIHYTQKKMIRFFLSPALTEPNRPFPAPRLQTRLPQR